jgi:signal transduction histidine kinase
LAEIERPEADERDLSVLAPYLRELVHEIKNPLAVIYGEAFTLRQQAVGVGEVDRQQIQQSADALERTSRRILDLLQGLRKALDTTSVGPKSSSEPDGSP